ncbi:MAG: rod shape-determining protein MreC [Elusimicrobiota bacterium]
MSKDFILAAVLTLACIILAALPIGPTVYAVRKVVFYLINPTANAFLDASKHASKISSSWHDLFTAREELGALRESVKQGHLESLAALVEQNEAGHDASLDVMASRVPALQQIKGLDFSLAAVSYRPAGQKNWASIACLRGAQGAELPTQGAVLQFYPQLDNFVLAGKMLPAEQEIGGFKCMEMLTGADYSVTVAIERTGEIALMRGVGHPGEVVIEYLPKDSQAQRGDVVVTAGSSWIAPAGIAVGVIDRVLAPSPDELFARAYLKPYFNLSKVEEVVVVSKHQEAGTRR